MITGGCRTQTTGANATDVTFHGKAGLLLSVTADGRLVPGPALSQDKATQELAALLVEYFGRGYGGAIRKAEEAADAARQKAHNATARANAAEARAKKAEAQVVKLEASIKARREAEEEEARDDMQRRLGGRINVRP